MEKGYGTWEHVSAMDPTVRTACWYTSLTMAGWVVNWDTGGVRRPSAAESG